MSIQDSAGSTRLASYHDMSYSRSFSACHFLTGGLVVSSPGAARNNLRKPDLSYSGCDLSTFEYEHGFALAKPRNCGRGASLLWPLQRLSRRGCAMSRTLCSFGAANDHEDGQEAREDSLEDGHLISMPFTTMAPLPSGSR